MVIVTGGWIQNAPNTHHDRGMSATGTLTCHDNSHPFQERTLSLENPIKIGRSVARARAAVDNAIFDCKVLSRNHAILWYESGKFFLKDTKSSNGTFVNNKRLSPSGEESTPFEVSSGDIVQFGVDVVDSTKKVTHGCIVASLKLYLPDGKEAKNDSANPAVYINITMEDLYKLNQFIQEAGRREHALRSKLDYMQQLLEYTRMSVNQSWKSLILEDCLISRLEMLENQVAAYSKSYGGDELKMELMKLLEDKLQYQNATKAVMQSKVHEKRDFVAKLQILKFRLNETEEESQNLHGILKNTRSELQELAGKYIHMQNNLRDTSDELNKNKNRLEEELKQADNEKEELLRKLKNQELVKKNLESDLRNSKLDTINIRKQITALQNYLQTLQDLMKLTNRLPNLQNSTAMATVNTWNTKYTRILNNKTWSLKLKCKEAPAVQDLKRAVNENYLLNHPCYTVIGEDYGSNATLSIDTSSSVCNWSQLSNTDGTVSTNTSLVLFANYCQPRIPDLVTSIQSNDTTNCIPIFKNYGGIPKQLDISPIECLMDSLSHEFVRNFEKNVTHSSFPKLVGNLLTSLTNLTWYSTTAGDVNHFNSPKCSLDYKGICMSKDAATNVTTLSPKNHLATIQCFTKLLQQNMMRLLNIFDRVNKDLARIPVLKQSNPLDHHTDGVDGIFMSKFDDHGQVMQEIQMIQELSEQLVILKERYNAITEEKSSLQKKYIELETQWKSPVNTEIVMKMYYILPISILLIWIILKYLLQMIL